MKFQLVAVPLSALALAGGVSAQTATGDTRAAERAWERTHRASKIIGTDVRNRQGQKIGDIKDVVLDGSGQIAYTVVATGGFLSMGDRLHAIPWTALQKDAGNNYFVLDMSKEQLKSAPGFDSKHWPNMADERWNSENRNHYATPSR